MRSLIQRHEICHRGLQEDLQENDDRNGDQEPHLTVDAIGKICHETETTIPRCRAVVPAARAGAASVVPGTEPGACTETSR